MHASGAVGDLVCVFFVVVFFLLEATAFEIIDSTSHHGSKITVAIHLLLG